jgi:hypothetical protein
VEGKEEELEDDIKRRGEVKTAPGKETVEQDPEERRPSGIDECSNWFFCMRIAHSLT